MNRMVKIGLASLALQNGAQAQALRDYCFEITPRVTIGMREVTTTPEDFLMSNPDIEAVINGMYFGSDNRPEGTAYLANGHHFATEKPEHTRGYFIVDRAGEIITVREQLGGKVEDYWLVIGTHPLLITEGRIDPQAQEERYAGSSAYRSAIGTKNGNDICFAVSSGAISMDDWASRLVEDGYQGAINLDGGPYSQLAIRENERIRVEGQGTQETRLVIFSYKRE